MTPYSPEAEAAVDRFAEEFRAEILRDFRAWQLERGLGPTPGVDRPRHRCLCGQLTRGLECPECARYRRKTGRARTSQAVPQEQE